LTETRSSADVRDPSDDDDARALRRVRMFLRCDFISLKISWSKKKQSHSRYSVYSAHLLLSGRETPHDVVPRCAPSVHWPSLAPRDVIETAAPVHNAIH